MSAAAVAREGYAAMMAGKPEVIAGARNRWMILLTRLAPRSMLARIHPAIEFECMSMEQVFDADDLRGVLHTPEQPTGDALALTHGAGSDSSAPLLVSLSRAFCDAGLLVLRYDLPFRVARAAADISRGAGARSRRRGSGGAGAAPAGEGARLCRRAFLRRQADRDDCGRASRAGRRVAAAFVSAASAEKAGSAAHCVFPGVAHARAVRPRHARSLRHAWKNCATRSPGFRRRVDLLAVEGAGHDLKPRGAHGRGDPGARMLF